MPCALCLVPRASLPAQGSLLLPTVPTFEYPYASTRSSAMVGRIMYLDRGETQFGKEWEAEAGLGEIWPLIALSRGQSPVTLHLGTEVHGRFSLGDAASAMISSDWQVNLILTADLRRTRLGIEALHESSHLGDEYSDRFPGARVNWSREILGVWAQSALGPVLVSANASYAAIDALDLPPWGVAVAADYRGKRGRVIGGGSAQLILAANADVQEYTDWDVTLGGKAGIRFSDPQGRRGFAMLLTFLDGRSPLRQFFAQKTRYFGFEVRFDL